MGCVSAEACSTTCPESPGRSSGGFFPDLEEGEVKENILVEFGKSNGHFRDPEIPISYSVDIQ